MTLGEKYEFRDDLRKYLERDVLGPSEDFEILDDAPLDQYVTGILYPRRANDLSPVDAENDLDTPEEDPEASPDPPVSLANRRYPSSMGVTFAVDGARARSIDVRVDTARYEEIPAEGESDRSQPRRRFGGFGSGTRWQRIPLSTAEPIVIDISASGDLTIPVSDGLELFGRVRPADGMSRISVTVVLVNRNVVETGSRDASAFFQAELSVAGSGGSEDVFVPRPVEGLTLSDEDVRSYRLLYRRSPVFAVGHGCSAEWELGASGMTATAIRSSFTPRYDLYLVDSNPAIESETLSMARLSRSPRRGVVADLERLAEGYEVWIRDRERQTTEDVSLDEELRATARAHLASAGAALERIRAGVALLREEEDAWRAFRLMNRAMLTQRARSDWLANGVPDDGPVEHDGHRWRPFQIAFILLTLPGIVTPTDSSRQLVDLLWFPTGGGKTEAYLGLIAFTVFLRRLRSENGGGVTALMRYTLRLLTAQQFQRAGLLIAACEAIRLESVDDLGNEPISIGLWVGRDATPLTRRDAVDALNKIRNGMQLDVGNPVQVRQCPWCGRAMSHQNYHVKSSSPLVIACGNADCLFRAGLPIYVIDEDIYEVHPTLLIATVDKFASLPWRESVASLFNLDSHQAPPELIIQDELHLISGPLGTLTGLYETVIDALSSANGIPAKVIASTATIRRASDQARGLFGRDVRQFPPPGIVSGDSYFAVEMPPDQKASRLYVGLSAPGVSQTTLLIRTYAALLQASRDLPGWDETRDPYWTLVGYFNSLRVLGAAEIQIRDDVIDRLELLAARAGTEPRDIGQRIEMTSREASSKIPAHLKSMSIAHPDPQAVDVILATNMISVGVDIDRLGLMVVMGQPQATSEYIQATSRIGRRHPGLVVTLLNAAKSRDRSHYESFVSYHCALYRQVEAPSVTPFSPRARDRALHAVVIGLARQLIPEARANADAGAVESYFDRLSEVAELIRARVAVVDADATAATARHVAEIIDRWRARAAEPGRLSYSQPRNPASALLVGAGQEANGGAMPTMWSLRDVDAETHFYLE